MQFNSGFMKNIKDIYAKQGEVWLESLPSLINLLCEKYQLRFIEAMPNLTYHFVGLVERLNTQETAIIKIAPTNTTIISEAKWLQCFDTMVPSVYWLDEMHHAYMMEHLAPGQPLTSIVANNDDDATRIICKTIKTLQSHQISTLPCKHLSEQLSCFSALKGHVEDKLLTKAISLFKDLTVKSSRDVLLHGDLHHDNILSSGKTWKVIDPHGYIGDPAFEVGPFIYNPPAENFPQTRSLKEIINRRMRILIEELPFDPQRMKEWTFCMTMLSMAWTAQDNQYVPEFELQVANIIDKI